jgi:hypothetical protein
MAKTAVVNPRRRRRRRRNPSSSNSNPSSSNSNPRRRRRRRRTNYSAAATVNPRRRRARSSRRRRRNPVSPYASSGYYRRPNPSFDVMNDLTETMPAGVAGIWLTRFALKQAGPYEPDAKGVLQPGIKHAVACYLAATMGAPLVGSVLGSGKEGIAKIASLAFAGDLFLRARFMKDSEFVKNNLSLQGRGEDDEGYYVPDGMDGFSTESPIGLGSTFTDAFGNTFVGTPTGWQLAGADDVFQDEQGNMYQLGQAAARGGARLAGFAKSSPIAGASSFGYAG